MGAHEEYGDVTDSYFSGYLNDTPGYDANPLAYAFQKFAAGYRPVFAYLALTICVLSVIANILNIIVLTRKRMVSAVHTFLLGLAVSDGLKVIVYIPWVLHTYIIHGTAVSPARHTLSLARYSLFWAITSTIIHSASVWLTVMLAIFRYLCVRSPNIRTKYGNVGTARIAVIMVMLFAVIVCLPNSIIYKVTRTPASLHGYRGDNANVSIWVIDKRYDGILQDFNFWIQAIFVRLLPCLLLMIFTILLVRIMRNANKMRKSMTTNNTFSMRSERTTKMLLSVVVLFLLTETPHGILILLSCLIQNFFKDFYIPLGDVIDTLALINNGVNFVLYCTMSKEFRRQFVSLFCRCLRQVEAQKPTLLRN